MHGSFASFLRGLYFIRFALALWFILLTLGPLDHFTAAASFTRGILTPESRWQASTASFMVFSVGMIVLLLVRIIAVNGQERFDDMWPEKKSVPGTQQDSWLRRNFGGLNLSPHIFVAAHFPGAVLLCFVGFNMVHESAMDLLGTIGFLALGIASAYLFWLFVGLVYYGTFDPHSSHPVPREVILPRRLIPLTNDDIKQIQQAKPPPLSNWLGPLFRLIARLGNGFASPPLPDHLYEGHRLAFIAFLGFVVLYIFFFSFTAPVLIPHAEIISNSIAVFSVALVLTGCALGTWPARGIVRRVRILAIFLLTCILLALISIWVTHTNAPRGFSVLGSVLILITGIFWLLATLAFVWDGTRLPVLSVSLVFICFLKGCVPYPAEHYFTVVTQNAPFPAAPTPSDVLDKRIEEALNGPGTTNFPPLIIVTAEGGGIHSAAWTANVLAELENTFRAEGAIPFHSQILLASGVSGGSVGLLPFLREYTAPNPFPVPSQSLSDVKGNPVTDPVRARLTLAADCSSLQAVAWGLTYYDIANFLWPLPIEPKSGIASSRTPSSGYDRSWALERSLDRNLSDHDCGNDYKTLQITDPKLEDAYRMTLHRTADLLRERRIPAFTFNTTAAETGGRFLLSNYELDDEPTPSGILGTDILPAESFLHSFAHENNGVKRSAYPAGYNRLYADVPLATAARLSGTFPFVSSASRIPKAVSEFGFHFIDGGYYDNDGTASAMEFLYFALYHSKYLSEASIAASARPRLPILLIEIRNDPDIPENENADGFTAQNHLIPAGEDKFIPDPDSKPAPAWGPDDQIIAPIKGFYEAGHASDTRRNRRELCLFETAFRQRLSIHHMIFDYRNPRDKNQALSWDLTPNQQHNIACGLDPHTPECSAFKEQQGQEANSRSIHILAVEAATWTKAAAEDELPDETCKTTGLGPKVEPARARDN